MANLNFYAAPPEDWETVLSFVYERTDCIAYEGTAFDRELRTFATMEEVIAANAQTLYLWAPALGSEPRIKRTAVFVPGHTFRHDVEGWGLMQLLFGQVTETQMRPGRLSNNSEKRSLKWEPLYPELGPVSAWDWKAVERLSRRIEDLIRRRAVASHHSIQLLPGAARLAADGVTLSLG